MRHLARVLTLSVILAYVTVLPAGAGWLSWLERAAVNTAETAASTAAKYGARAASFATRADAAAALAAVGGDTLYFEAQGARIVTRTLDGAIGPDIPLRADWVTELLVAAKPASANALPALTVDIETAMAVRQSLPDLISGARVFLAGTGGRIYRLRNIPGGGIGAEIRPSLLVPITGRRVPEHVFDYLNSPVSKNQVNLVTTLTRDDADSFRRLALPVGDKLSSLEALSVPRRTFQLPGNKGDVIVFLGHVEENGYAVRTAANDLAYSVPFSRLESAAVQEGKSAVFVGCNTYSCSGLNGTTSFVTDHQVEAMLRSLPQAETNADLLASFGTEAAPFIVGDTTLRGAATARYMRLEGVAVGGRPVQITAVGLRLASAVVGGAAGTALHVLIWSYAGGAAFALLLHFFDKRSISAVYFSLYPQIANRELDPDRHLREKTSQILLLWLLAPIIANGYLILLLLGATAFNFKAWRDRDDWLLLLWSIVLRPIAPGALVLALVSRVAIYVVLVAVALSMLALAIPFIHVPQELQLPLTLVLALGSLIGAYIFRSPINGAVDDVEGAIHTMAGTRFGKRGLMAATALTRVVPALALIGTVAAI